MGLFNGGNLIIVWLVLKMMPIYTYFIYISLFNRAGFFCSALHLYTIFVSLYLSIGSL